MSLYRLQHKDNVVAFLEFSEDFREAVIRDILDNGELPIALQGKPENIQYWWKRRCRPSRDEHTYIPDPVIRNAYAEMIGNLALSTDDAYWVVPMDLILSWKEVSFHSNPISSWRYSPDTTMQGANPKKWIWKDGELFLQKGNMSGHTYMQSINEVFASLMHGMQGFGNYVHYSLYSEENSRRMYSISKAFTSDNVEFIPAWQFFMKYGHEKGNSRYSEYIGYLEREGLSRKKTESFLSYMLLTDFIITNVDRNYGNFGVLRNADTLELIAPAPIFDSGNSMFHEDLPYVDVEDLANIRTMGLFQNEMEMLENPSLQRDILDISKLPTGDIIRELYFEDPVLLPFTDKLVGLYEYKIDALTRCRD